MMFSISNRGYRCFNVFGLGMILLILVIGGCDSHVQKSEADREVYEIIDSKWQSNFGEKANYKIADVENDDHWQLIDVDEKSLQNLSLAKALQIAVKNNRSYQTQKEQLYLAALDLSLTRHDYVRRWFCTIDGSFKKDSKPEILRGNYNKNGKQESLDAGGNLGFGQLFEAGTELTVGIAVDWMRFFASGSNMSLGSVLTAAIRHPLLRGSGKRIATENLTQAERDLIYQMRHFARNRKEFVISVVSRYYKVLQKKDSVQNSQNSYQRKSQAYEILSMKVSAGRRNLFEADQARQSMLNAKTVYLRTAREYRQMLDEFKIVLALPTDCNVTLNQNELTALADLEVEIPNYSIFEALEMSLLARLDLATSADKVDDALRKVMVAEDNLNAKFDIVGSLAADSKPKTRAGEVRFDQGDYSLGFDADLPFDSKARRNSYRRALIALSQTQRQFDDDMENVKLGVMVAYNGMQEKIQQYKIQQSSVELSKKRIDNNNILFYAGKLSTRDFLESQDALFLAENQLTNVLVDYAITKLNFFNDIGVMQVKPDGMWEAKQ